MDGGTIQQHLTEADRALKAGANDVARHHLDAVLAFDSSHPGARNWLGLEALERNDPRAAIEHFTIACERDPKGQPLWMNLARAYRELGDAAGERNALEQVLALDRRDLLALIRLAELHERLGEATLAAKHWSAVVALSANIPNRSAEFAKLIERGTAYVQDQQRKLADAIAADMADELVVAGTRDRRRMAAAADHWLGKRPIYANHCEGLHYPFLPADEFFDREHFPWLEQLEAATPAILAELLAILADGEPGLEPYIAMEDGVPQSQWSALDKSLDWGAFHLWKEGDRIGANCARAPQTAEFVESLPLCRIPGRAPAVFFSILKAGSHIPPHTGVTNVRSIVHLGLIVPDGCGFRVGGETREWREGEAFVFDDTIEHEAWNRSDKDRAVLIIDTWNPHLSEHEREMVCRFYETADRQRGMVL
ncbi:aspartyl/asparaginyl beta-hydroxylase domain-containing protein [Sphingomonas daechungensis]|uniref:aspartyl/asparaginyl beta-hydroxylase domain-containing protein n=1 Tax=Sphingomonas daechungensis TaxID=1176646 RepID=UPI0037839424